MNFDLSEEQRLLKDSVERLLADRYDFERRKRYRSGEDGFSREMWARYAELGLLGLPFAEEHGGFGGGAVETMIVMEAFGRALVVEPYLSTVVLAGGALAARRRREAEGALPARHRRRQAPPRARAYRAAFALRSLPTSRRPRGGTAAASSSTATRASCSAATAPTRSSSPRAPPAGGATGAASASSSSTPSAAGVTRRGYPTQDGMRAAEIALAGVRVGPEAALGDPENALPADRARRRRGHGRALRRGGRRDGRDARADGRVPQDAPAVRRRHRRLPGAAAPRGRHVRRPRAGALHGDARRR